MEKITIRRATPEDKDAVLRINDNVFGGRDYLPAYYDHFLTAPDMFPAVMLYEKQIIAFEVGHIIDNGETVVDRAGRIHTQFEGKGLVKYMSQYLLDWGISKGVNAIAFTITDGSAYLSRESFQRTTKYILTKHVPVYYIAGQGLTFSEKDVADTRRLTTVSHDHISQYFSSKSVREYISPKGRMIVDGVPYKMMSANLSSMMGPGNFTVIYSDIREEHGKCSGLLSVGLVFPIPTPQYKYVLDIFGDDIASLKTHIVKHLLRLREKTQGITAMLVFIPEETDVNQVDKVFKEYGITRQPHKSLNSKLKTRQIYAYEGSQQFNSKI